MAFYYKDQIPNTTGTKQYQQERKVAQHNHGERQHKVYGKENMGNVTANKGVQRPYENVA